MGILTPHVIHEAYKTSPLIRRAWASVEQYQTYLEFLHRSTPQIQLGVFVDKNRCVGLMNLAHGLDPQVGPVMTVLHNFLEESHRGSYRLQATLLRKAAEVCAEDEIKWLITPHRRTPGVQVNIYKEITWETP